MSSDQTCNQNNDKTINNSNSTCKCENQCQCYPSNYCTYCNNSCNRFCCVSPCCNVYLVTTVACELFKCLSANEIAILAANLTMLGDTLIAMQTQQEICCPCPDNNLNDDSITKSTTDQSSSTDTTVDSNSEQPSDTLAYPFIPEE